MWAEQLEFFSQTREVITFDWPGFGESLLSEERPAEKGMDAFVESLRRQTDRHGARRVHLCGLSMGGYVALAALRAVPELIASLILCDTRATRDSEEVRRGRLSTAASVREQGITTLLESMPPRLLGETTLRQRPDIVARVRSMIAAASPEGTARALIAMAERQDSTDLLGKISVPTLIIAGKEDKLTPPEEMRTMADAIHGSSFAIIEGAGHLPNIEQPALFNQLIEDFFSDL